jgi:hypothetical protein
MFNEIYGTLRGSNSAYGKISVFSAPVRYNLYDLYRPDYKPAPFSTLRDVVFKVHLLWGVAHALSVLHRSLKMGHGDVRPRVILVECDTLMLHVTRKDSSQLPNPLTATDILNAYDANVNVKLGDFVGSPLLVRPDDSDMCGYNPYSSPAILFGIPIGQIDSGPGNGSVGDGKGKNLNPKGPADPPRVPLPLRPKAEDDWWAFGGLIYLLFSGRQPWQGLARGHVEAQMTRGQRSPLHTHDISGSLFPGIPPLLCELMIRCFAFSEKDRPDDSYVMSVMNQIWMDVCSPIASSDAKNSTDSEEHYSQAKCMLNEKAVAEMLAPVHNGYLESEARMRSKKILPALTAHMNKGNL